jgi:hypothetical protein
MVDIGFSLGGRVFIGEMKVTSFLTLDDAALTRVGSRPQHEDVLERDPFRTPSRGPLPAHYGLFGNAIGGPGG